MSNVFERWRGAVEPAETNASGNEFQSWRGAVEPVPATTTIGTGQDFATIALWSAHIKTLGTLSQNHVGVLNVDEVYTRTAQADLDFSAITLNGFTITLQTNPAIKHDGSFGTGARIETAVSSGALYDVKQLNLIDMSITNTEPTGGGARVFATFSDGSATRCIFKTDSVGINSPVIQKTNGLVLSCRFVGGTEGILAANASITTIKNATCTGQSNAGVWFTAATLSGGLVQNTVVYDCAGTDFLFTDGTPILTTATNNASEDGTHPGTSGVTLTSNPFEADGYTPVKDGALDGAGVWLSIAQDASNLYYSPVPAIGAYEATLYNVNLPVANITKACTYVANKGKIVGGPRAVLGHNINPAPYFGNGWPYLNVLHGGRWAQDNGTRSSDGFPDLTAGGTPYFIFNSPNSDANEPDGYGYSFPGNRTYVFVWTGTCPSWSFAGADSWVGGNMSVTFDGPNETIPVNRYEIFIPSNKSTGNELIRPTVSGTITSFAMYDKNYETEFNAGQNLHPDFLADMAGARIIRWMPNQAISNSGVRTYAEMRPYTFCSQNNTNWSENTQYWAMNTQWLCECQNEISAYNKGLGHGPSAMWWCEHGMMNDAGMQAEAADIATYLDTDIPIYLELANEIWNYSSAYANVTDYFYYGGITEETATCNPTTGVFTKVSHGMANGTQIACYLNSTHHIYPYSNGGKSYVINATADTFELSATSGGAQRTIPIADNLMETLTIIYYKQTAGQSQNMPYWKAKRDMEMWAFYHTALDATHTVYNVAAGQAVSSSQLTQHLAYPGFREAMDFYAIAPYCRPNYCGSITIDDAAVYTGATKTITYAGLFANGVAVVGETVEICGYHVSINPQVVDGTYTIATVVDDDSITLTTSVTSDNSDTTGLSVRNYANYTYEQATDTIINDTGPAGLWSLYTDAIEAMNVILGEEVLIAYECGEHNGGHTYNSPAEKVWNIEYSRSTAATRLYEWFFPKLRDLGIKVIANFGSHWWPAYPNGSWGVWEHPQDTDAAKYLGIKTFLDDGGVPRP